MARTALRQPTIYDWRAVPDVIIEKLLAAERWRWEETLDWDPGSAWAELDLGRQLGTVSGLVTFAADGQPAGWTYYLVHNDTLQIGAFVSDSVGTTAALLEGILSDPSTADAARVTFFAFTTAPGVVDALRARSLTVDRYWYLRRDIVSNPGVRRSDIPKWRMDHLSATAALLQRAFEPRDLSRPFAPDGTDAEWQEYVARLVTGTGCGTLLPSACHSIGIGPDRLAAVALVTRIGPLSAHLAQLAVDPAMRGRHLGATLVEAACHAAAHAGCTRMTLLVGGGNQAARTLYERARFEPVGTFVAAGGVRRAFRAT
jgi:ribosomal protein S18 acetylase RimI-like enzyme